MFDLLIASLVAAAMHEPGWSSMPVLPAFVGDDPVDGAAVEEPSAAFDPTAGIGAAGEIVRPELPADLAHPSRWRYTPPGRIAPGNVFERFLVSTFFSPVIFRDEDVGTGGGLALTDIDFRNQDYREFANLLLTYTTEGQQSYRINWRRWLEHRHLDAGGIIREERSSLFGSAGYSRTLTRRYFGRGSRTDENDETSYTDELTELGLGVRLSLPEPGGDVLATGAVRFRGHGLSTGRVSDVPSTDESFGGDFADGDGVDQLWLDAGIAYDTRDSLHQPYEGWRVGFEAETAALQTGGEFGGRFTFDSQVVLPVSPVLHAGGIEREENPPTDVVVLNGFIVDTHGDLPFYDLPSLGGSRSLRGFIDNRFTDRAALHGSVEYRFGIVPRGFAFSPTFRIERVSLGLFYDFGTVADGLGSLDDGRFHDSVGIGLRLSFAREAAFRFDYGVSDEGGNLAIRFGYAF